MSFHQDDEYSLKWWIFIEKLFVKIMSFHQSNNFYLSDFCFVKVMHLYQLVNQQFLLKLYIKIKVTNSHQSNWFSLKWWFFVKVMSFHQNNDYFIKMIIVFSKWWFLITWWIFIKKMNFINIMNIHQRHDFFSWLFFSLKMIYCHSLVLILILVSIKTRSDNIFGQKPTLKRLLVKH